MIFISYSWRDCTYVGEFAAALERAGRDAWLDRDRLDLSKRIEPQVFRAIQASTLLVVVDSASARESAWVRAELDVAQYLLDWRRIWRVGVGVDVEMVAARLATLERFARGAPLSPLGEYRETSRAGVND